MIEYLAVMERAKEILEQLNKEAAVDPSVVESADPMQFYVGAVAMALIEAVNEELRAFEGGG